MYNWIVQTMGNIHCCGFVFRDGKAITLNRKNIDSIFINRNVITVKSKGHEPWVQHFPSSADAMAFFRLYHGQPEVTK